MQGIERVLAALWTGLRQVLRQSTLALFGLVVVCSTGAVLVIVTSMAGDEAKLIGLIAFFTLLALVVCVGAYLARKSGAEWLLGERAYERYGSRARPLNSREIRGLPGVTPPAQSIELPPPTTEDEDGEDDES